MRHRQGLESLPQRHAPRRGPDPRARTSSPLASRSSGVASLRRSRLSPTTRCATSARRARLLSDGIQLPALKTRFRDRHALVVVRGPGHKRDLRIVRPYVRDFRPVLIGVDGGADALLEAGYKPDVIVGDMDSVGDACAQRGAELLVHAYPDGRRAGRRAPRRARARVHGRAGPGDSRGRGAPARLREGSGADRRRRDAPQPDRVPRARPRGDVVDLPDQAEGGRDPGGREGRLQARFTPRGRMARSLVFALAGSGAA